MKRSSFSSSESCGIRLGILNALLAILLTLISFRYVQPINCYRSCMGPYAGQPCLPGGCYIGEQKAGWPLPVFVDAPGGGSPTSGWGILGPEDIPDFRPLLLDIFFYSALVWLAIYILNLVQWKTLHLRSIMLSLPLDLLLAAGLWLFCMLFPYALPIGRGHVVQVYANTPTETLSSNAFLPVVPIQVEELIQTFGEPDNVLITRELPSSALSTVLHWSSAGVYADLPPSDVKAHVINRTTHVKRIIFSDDPQVWRIDGRPLGEKNDPWAGYGEYPP